MELDARRSTAIRGVTAARTSLPVSRSARPRNIPFRLRLLAASTLFAASNLRSASGGSKREAPTGVRDGHGPAERRERLAYALARLACLEPADVYLADAHAVGDPVALGPVVDCRADEQHHDHRSRDDGQAAAESRLGLDDARRIVALVSVRG